MTRDITIIKTTENQLDDKRLEVCLKEEYIRNQAKNAREHFGKLQTELDEIEDDLKDGLSYLDMKNDTLLSYMIDLCNIVLRKTKGVSISDHASVERTVYYRVVLEKIKAIDQRLAYQLNKVITMPEDDSNEIQGVNINNLDVDLSSDDDEGEDNETEKPVKPRDLSEETEDDDEDEDEDEDEDDDDDVSVDSDASNDDIDEGEDEDDEIVRKDSVKISKKPVGVYKPPKLRSVAYVGDREANKARRRRDYNEIYQDDDDIHDVVEETRARRDDERTRYEEENYTRLPDMNPKKVKRKAQKTKSKGKRFKSSKKR